MQGSSGLEGYHGGANLLSWGSAAFSGLYGGYQTLSAAYKKGEREYDYWQKQGKKYLPDTNSTRIVSKSGGRTSTRNYPSSSRKRTRARSNRMYSRSYAKRRRSYGRPAYRGGYGRRRRKRYRKGYNRSGVGSYGSPMAENKYYDTTLNRTTTSTNAASAINTLGHGGVASFVNVPQGTGVSERIGEKFVVTSIDIRYHVETDLDVFVGTEACQETSVKVFLILDRQANGSVPTESDIWDTANGTSDTWHMVYANMDNRKRFKVLKTWNITLQPNTNVGGNGTNMLSVKNRTGANFEYHKKCRIPIYMNTGAADSDIRSNNLIMWVQQSGNVRGSTALNVNHEAQVRVRYVDS